MTRRHNVASAHASSDLGRFSDDRSHLAHAVQRIVDMISNREELKDRIKAKQRELEARFNELKADSRSEARGERERVRSRLDELQETLKEGWDNMSDKVSAKLNDWLNKK